jgi:hypothetical protein
MSDGSPRMSKWLSTAGWVSGALLFIRLAQVLPCCQSPSLEASLHGHICGATFVNPCPRYEDSAPR